LFNRHRCTNSNKDKNGSHVFSRIYVLFKYLFSQSRAKKRSWKEKKKRQKDKEQKWKEKENKETGKIKVHKLFPEKVL